MSSFWGNFAANWRGTLSNKETLLIEKKVSESVQAKLDQIKKKETKKKILSIEDSIFADFDEDDEDLW